MGGASFINILVSLVRLKLVAVLLGPAGVGLIGLFSSLISTAGAIAALGFGTVGTRQIAEANGGGRIEEVAAARRALFWGTMGLSLLGGLGFFLLRDVMASRVLADPLRATDLGWLSLAVVLTVAGGSQSALLNGLRRIGDLARLQVSSAIVATVLGVAALLLWGEAGLIVYVLVGPLASFVMGHWYVARIGRIVAPPTPLPVLARQWGIMVRLGFAFMLSGVVVSVGHLTVRSLVQTDLGPAALGQFQAAWTISMTYLGFVLGAMGTDYYPRLTATIADPVTTARLVNEQTEVALLLAGPVLLGLLALAPWAIRLLYTAEFAPATDILRWQVLGDFLKVISWPLGFILLAKGAGKTFVVTESVAIGIFVVAVWIGLPLIGITATGVGFLIMYACYLPLVYGLARWRIGFRWSAEVTRQVVVLGLAAVLVDGAARWSEPLAVGVGLLAAFGFGLYGLGRLGTMAELSGPVGRIAAVSRRMTNGWRRRT